MHIDTAQFITAALEYAAVHSQEDAYQAITLFLTAELISLDQWHEAVQALYAGEHSTR